MKRIRMKEINKINKIEWLKNQVLSFVIAYDNKYIG